MIMVVEKFASRMCSCAIFVMVLNSDAEQHSLCRSRLPDLIFQELKMDLFSQILFYKEIKTNCSSDYLELELLPLAQ